MSIRDVSGMGRAGPAAGQSSRPRENADPESVGRLERALKGPGRREDGKSSGDQEKKRDTSEREAGPLSGAAILRGLQGMDPGPAGAGLPGASDIEGRLEAISEVADRLLVSEPGSADKEIRILIKESLLPGAEVRLTLQEGRVGVNFVCKNDQSALFLEQHRADLERRLEDRLGGPARVQVERDTSGQGDGRSRGQRDLYAEYQED